MSNLHYKLYYFNAKGRAEPIRLIFALAGQKYEDFRFEKDQWPQYKARSPSGHVPMLEVSDGSRTASAARTGSATRESDPNNFTLFQSTAIVSFLGRQFNLYGKNVREQSEVDQFILQAQDLHNEIVRIFLEPDETKKNQEMPKLLNETIPANLRVFEHRLGRINKPHLIPSGITIADVYLFSVLDVFGPEKDKVFPHFPNLKKLYDYIGDQSGIKEHLAKRPNTAY